MSSLKEIEQYAGEFPGQDWTVIREGGTVKFVRDGYVRVIVCRLGGDWFTITWEYSMGTGESSADWRVERYPTDEIGMQTHMTLNAMWR